MRGHLDWRTAQALGPRRPTAAAKAELRGLIAEGRKLAAAAAAPAGRLAEEREETLQTLRAERENRPPATDPKPLREKYAALGKMAERARNSPTPASNTQEIAKASPTPLCGSIRQSLTSTRLRGRPCRAPATSLGFRRLSTRRGRRRAKRAKRARRSNGKCRQRPRESPCWSPAGRSRRRRGSPKLARPATRPGGRCALHWSARAMRPPTGVAAVGCRRIRAPQV